MESESEDSDSSSSHHLKLYNPRQHCLQIRDLHSKVFEYSKELTPTVSQLKAMQGFVTMHDNKITGYLLFTKCKRYYYLDYIGVHPKYRSQKLGVLLINRFTRFLDTHQYYALLEVEQNTEYTEHLIRWYQRNGFSKYKIDLIENGVNLTSMVRFPRDETQLRRGEPPVLMGVKAIS